MLKKEYDREILERIEESDIVENNKKKGEKVDMHERNLEWKRKREEKLEEARKIKSVRELEGCSFKPKVNKGFITWNAQFLKFMLFLCLNGYF